MIATPTKWSFALRSALLLVLLVSFPLMLPAQEEGLSDAERAEVIEQLKSSDKIDRQFREAWEAARENAEFDAPGDLSNEAESDDMTEPHEVDDSNDNENEMEDESEDDAEYDEDASYGDGEYEDESEWEEAENDVNEADQRWTPPGVSVVPVPESVTNSDVIEDAGDFPWYDAENRSLHPTAISKEPVAPTPWDWTWDWDSNGTGSANWDFVWTVVQVIVWASLACLVIWLVLMWMRYLSRQDFRPSIADLERQRQRHEIDSIEQLPFQMAKPQSDLLSEARRHYQQGNYREAIIYLFSHQLVQLDRHQKIRLAKGKTNRQYLFELRQQAGLRDLLRMTTHLFEDVFFGHYELTQQQFEQVWSKLDEFDRLVQQEAP